MNNLDDLIEQIDKTYPTWELRLGFASQLNFPANKIIGCQSLLNLKVLMADDIKHVIASFIPGLNATCAQQAEFLLHKNESKEIFAEKIISMSPSLLLLDGSLAAGIRGWDVLRIILKQAPQINCFGFSAEPKYEKYFTEAGAKAFVHKRTSDLAATIRDIADNWAALNELE